VRVVVDKVALGQVFLRALEFRPSVSFNQCPMLVFIYMLLLPAGQTGECWEPREKNAVSKIGEHY